MSSDFETYKNNRIIEFIKIYNDNYKIIINNFNNVYKQILNNRFYKNKQQALNTLTNDTNRQINNLNSIFNANINKIKNLTLTDPIISNKKNALLVGINYIGTSNELSGSINDVNSMEQKLLKAGFTNFIKLTDKTDIKPTKNAIIKEFTNLLKSGNSGDLLCFFYSGHGSYIFDKSGDEVDGRDELIVPIDMNILSDDELKSIIQTNLQEGVTLLAIFDSCFSGSILDLKYMYNDSLNLDKYTEYSRELETKGNVICLSSSNDNQTSSEAFIKKEVRGALCACLTDIITDNNITWRNLLQNIRKYLKDNGFNQIPQLSSGKIMNMDTKVFI